MARMQIALVIGAFAVVGAGPAVASPIYPDLVETKLSATPRRVPVGSTLTVTDEVRNEGTGPARHSTTRFYLAAQRHRTRLGKRRVPELSPFDHSAGTRSFTLPKGIGVGRYALIACADARRRVAELDEHNCRWLGHKITVVARDRTSPKFGGLESAVTCLGGPVGDGRKSAYHLKWKPATDNDTRQSAIVYEVYQATKSGGEDLAHPTYTTQPGATSYTTPALSSDKAYYFIVRARDRGGNRDSNTAERQGENPCV